MRRARALSAAALLALVAPAAAEDDVPAPTADDQPTLRGMVRAGWRLISRDDEGRFQQDVGLEDGPRLFELELFGSDPRGTSCVDEMELRFAGVGDPYSDYLLSLRRRGSFEVSGGYRRDDYDYVSSGDPFRHDGVHERSFVRGLWTPNGDTAVRIEWDRNDRRGEADTFGYGTDASGFAQAQFEPRRYEDESDRFTLGGDYAVGIFRFGLTQTVALTSVHETSAFAADDTSELDVRSKAYSTAAKIAAALFDGKLDLSLFAVRTSGTTEDRAQILEPGPLATSPPQSDSFDGEIDRRATTYRLEAAWRPRRDWEFVFAAEKYDLEDDLSGTEDLQTVPPSSPPSPTTSLVDADVEHRERRLSADATWDASDALRLRLGEEFLHEELLVPTDSHFAPYGESSFDHPPTDLSSDTFRTVAGADWRPSKKFSLAATAHVSHNNEPQTTATARDADDWTLRGRWKPTDELALTTVWKRMVIDNSEDVPFDQFRGPNASPRPVGVAELDSTSRSSSVTQSVAWTKGPWAVQATGTYRRLDTKSDSAYYDAGALVEDYENVSWRGRDVIVDLGVRYEFTRDLRVHADAVRSNARDEMESHGSAPGSHVRFPARRLDVHAGAEYDFGREIETDEGPRRNMTLGLTVSSWRLVDEEAPEDSYRAYGVELSLAYRF